MSFIPAILGFVCLLPAVCLAEPPGFLVPAVDPGTAVSSAPVPATWAHAGREAVLHLDSPSARELSCTIYQIQGALALPLVKDMPLPPLVSGVNTLKIPLPEAAKRGKLLCKITGGGETVANLRVNLLPADAWDSLSRLAQDGKVFISPGCAAFLSWAADHSIPSHSACPATDFYFGKPAGNPDAPPPARTVIYELEADDSFPILEIRTTPAGTKILLPPGFFAALPDSPSAQAILLKSLRLLP
ncbi:MAG: hypothetical protein QM680_01585 [Luteolibacter sp.]